MPQATSETTSHASTVHIAVAVVVPVIVPVIVLVAAALLFWWTRRSRRTTHYESENLAAGEHLVQRAGISPFPIYGRRSLDVVHSRCNPFAGRAEMGPEEKRWGGTRILRDGVDRITVDNGGGRTSPVPAYRETLPPPYSRSWAGPPYHPSRSEDASYTYSG